MRVARLTSMTAKGSRYHYEVALVMVSLIPGLTVVYFAALGHFMVPLSFSGVAVLVLGLLISPILGHAILMRYPATIVRLRKYVQRIADGEIPDQIDLLHEEDDVTALSHSMKLIVERLREKLNHSEEEKTILQDEMFQLRQIESVGALAAGIAHEINTPLQFISTNLQFLKSAVRHDQNLSQDELTDLHAEIDNSVTDASEGIERISTIVAAMRDYSTSGNCDEWTPIDLNRVIQDTVALTKNEWKYVADVVTDLDPAMPALPCAPGEIKQSIMNLLINSAQALAAGTEGRDQTEKGTIWITTRATGDRAVITIKDNGPGIAAALQSRVFDPLFTTRKTTHHIGQGLAFVHAAIVKRHRGKLRLATDAGTGCMFTIELPLAQADFPKTKGV